MTQEIKLPGSVYDNLTPAETVELAKAVLKKMKESHPGGEVGFDEIHPILCRIIVEGRGKIAVDLDLGRIEDLSRRFTESTESFHWLLEQVAEDQRAEAACTFSLSKNGDLPEELAIKVGKIIRDIINANGIQAKEENMRLPKNWRTK